MSLLEADEVMVRFGGRQALSGVSLSVEPGRVTGLIGPNGAGKTTLFNVLTGLRAPDGGGVRLAGRRVDGLAPHRRARLGVARTFQLLELFGRLTVEENVRLAASLNGANRRRGVRRRVTGAATGAAGGAVGPGGSAVTARRLLDLVGLSHLATTPAADLSTGLGRRLELARALAIGPRVLLLDEPASGQDESETVAFADLLRALVADGLAILLVEHDMRLVMDVCAFIYVLDHGQVIAAGTPAEIRADSLVRAAYLGTPVESLAVAS